MNRFLIIAASLGYLATLFAIAYAVEQRLKRGKSFVKKGWVYALSLAVYCSGWTYYGSVGRATTSGLEFITIYLGPSIMCALFIPVLQKVLRICKTQRINSIADFISTRYGKNFQLGILVTLCCVIGVIPYISLQLKAISSSFHVITGSEPPAEFNLWHDDSLYITIIITLFIIFFGTRSVDASERHEGLVTAVAFESIIKLIAFLAVGLFVTYGVFEGFDDLFVKADTENLDRFFTLSGDQTYSSWFTMILVSMFCMILLPRQFQVAVVENTREEHLRKAVWLFPLYLFLINVFVLPIAIGGTLTFGNTMDADTFVLSLPLHFNQNALSLLVYIGGFSAASSMMIVETIALATMVSNHLVLPAVFSSQLNSYPDRSLTKSILYSRRASIIIMLLLAYLYHAFIAPYFSLVSIGIVSMVAVAQFAPTFIGGLYWRNAARTGAMAGLIVGFLVWAYTLLLPSVIDAGFLNPDIMISGPWKLSWLRPNALFGVDQFALEAHSFFWSILLNTLCFVIGSLYSTLSAQEVYQAEVFVDIFKHENTTVHSGVWRGTAVLADIHSLLARFIGVDRSNNLITSYAHRHKILLNSKEADPRLVAFTERILSGVVGSASARFLVSNITKEEEITMEEVMNIVRESQQVLELNKELKRNSLELTRATDQLREANQQLKRMDSLKDEFLYTVTHELRTPLTSIRALSEIVHDNPDMDEEQREFYLSNVIKETERLTHLITQVLNLERYESGRQKLHLTTVDLKELIQEVLDSLTPLAKEKHTTLKLALPDSMLLVQGDRLMLYQVFYNLISNAIKFVPDQNGFIKVAAEVDYSQLILWVEDNGKGIAPELHELIFDKFFQARNQTLKKPIGSGLGLAICKRVIEMHQGKIWVESKEGQGARFAFTLPFEQ